MMTELVLWIILAWLIVMDAVIRRQTDETD